jgi:pyrophosphate--fructose-6-phosphate 1-phosphotransferase
MDAEAERRSYVPNAPRLLLDGFAVEKGAPTTCVGSEDQIKAAFPTLYGRESVRLVAAAKAAKHAPLKVGCVLSGGQAAGGHNCICGLYDYLDAHAPGSTLLGFTGGPKGVMTNTYVVLSKETIDAYRNSGGFTMLASGRDKIETADQFAKAVATARGLSLDGLVVIGGDDSNTNAAVLAEHFAACGLKARVIGLPKTIDGDLKNEHCEISFGFDTAAKL